VSHPLKLVVLLLFLALAGCSTAPRPLPDGESPPDVDLSPSNQVVTPVSLASPALPPGPITNPPAKPPPAPKPPTFTVPPGTWVSLGRWAKENRLGLVTNLHSTVAPTYALTTPSGMFVLRTGSLLARWAGLELRLGYAPQIIGGEPYLHTLDLQKSLIPLLSYTPPPTNGPRTIVIDAGHGGTDSGTRSIIAGNFEKNYTLDWARRLKALLEAAGWTVFLTRTEDVELSLPGRVEFADQRRADLFVSLHFNSGAGPENSGIETYCTTPTGMPSSVTRDYEDNVTASFPNNRFDAQNVQLAMRIHREMLAATGGQDRGVRHARYMSVLRGQNRPAVLIEGGYLSSFTESKLINMPEYRQKLAEAVAKALQ